MFAWKLDQEGRKYVHRNTTHCTRKKALKVQGCAYSTATVAGDFCERVNESKVLFPKVKSETMELEVMLEIVALEVWLSIILL